MSFDFRRLRLGERLALLAGILLFVDLFLDWYGTTGRPGGSSAWAALSVLSVLMLLLVLGAVALAGLAAAPRSVALTIAASVILTALGSVLTLLVFYRVVVNEPGSDHLTTPRVGAWVGLLLCAAVTYGSYRSLREEGTTFADAREHAERVITSRGRTVPGSEAAGEPPAETLG